MVDPAIDPARRRAEHFASAALHRLAPLVEAMQLTVAEAQLGYVLLLAECLSHYSIADRQAVADYLHTWLPELAESLAQKRIPGAVR